MIRYLFFILILIYPHEYVFAQEDEGSVLVGRGVESALQSDYYQAARYYGRAKDYFLGTEEYDRYVECEFLYLDCLLKSSDFGKFAQSLEQLNRFVRSEQPKFRASFLDTIATSLALFEVEYLTRSGDIVQSMEALQLLYRDITERNQQEPSVYYDQRLIQITGKLAQAYAEQGDCENTQAYSAYSLSAIEPYRRAYVRDGSILQPYLLLARCFANSGDVTHAQQTYDRILGLLSETGSKKSQRAFDIYAEIFEFNLRQNNPDSAYVYLQKLKNLDNAEQHAAEILQLTGDYYLARGNLPFAEQSYIRTRTQILKRQGMRNEAMARCDLMLGSLYLDMQAPHQALVCFHRGLFAMSDIVDVPDDVFSNPPLSALFHQRDLLAHLKGKAAALHALYQDDPRPKYLHGAWETIRIGTRFMDGLRNSYSGDADKTLLLEESYPVFELALRLAYTLLEETHNEQWIDSAFLLMEESKALNLRDAVLHGQGRRFAGIPDSLLQFENTLRLEITGKEHLLREYRNSVHYQQSREVTYLNELAEKKDQYRRLIARYEREHPEYYALKHKAIAISVPQVRSVLVPGQTMLEYFIGDSAIYLLVINASQKQLRLIPKDFPLETWVRNYRNSLHEFSTDKSISSLSEYTETAYNLFHRLVPADLVLDSSLLIVPDGVLGYLSFSSLLRSPPQDVTDIRRYDFLLWQYTIAYTYSANLYLELQTGHAHVTHKALIVAPRFNGLSGIPPLEFNQSEARAIRKLTRGTLLAGHECTIPAFYEVLRTKPFSMLHLATHGSANDISGDASFLVFSGHERDSALLYARDLYNLDLPLELVYLSACETATGELRKGEGIISLARGFFYAGVQSLVTTLWRIEDSRSAALSESFYAHLAGGIRKDIALCKTQRQYLAGLAPEDKIYAHPVYWSALIPVGNIRAMDFGVSRHYPQWSKGLLGVLGILCLGFIIMRLRRRLS